MSATMVLATRNRKKVEELGRMLAVHGVEVVDLDRFSQIPAVEEDGVDFAANAVKKAVAVAAATGVCALADDSGLVVDALEGAPGVRSARYAADAGAGEGDLANLQLLLRQMAGVAEGSRGARFECVVAVATPQGGEWRFHGTVEGSIARHPAGDNGFGYDPIFVPAGFDRTFAQMSSTQKDELSHRGRALAKFMAALSSGGLQGAFGR